MAEPSVADLRNMLTVRTEAGQVTTSCISEINTALEKLAISQQESARKTSRMETSLDRVIQANTTLNRSVFDLKLSMERVATRLTSVEITTAKLSSPEDTDRGPIMFRPIEQHQANRNQGIGTEEDHTSSGALVRGEHSEAYDPDGVLSDDDVDIVT
jgi:hypothetical protein